MSSLSKFLLNYGQELTSPSKLGTFEYKGKVWTVDPRLQEFRFIQYGEVPEYLSFDSEEGRTLMKAFKVVWGRPF